MTNKEKILLCIDWFERSAEQARHSVNENDWAEASWVIKNWLIKDANEALEYLKNGIKDEEVHEHNS